MAVEPQDDTERLNALVDGELAPAARAALAERIAADRSLARAHATLARLKSCVAELGEAEPSGVVPRTPARWRRRLPTAAGVAAAALLGLWLALPEPARAPETPLPHAAITLAALPASPVVPHLDRAGLTLTGVAVAASDGDPVVVATYRGPRGCRLELHAAAAGHAFPPTAGTRRHAWTAGPLAYQLVAFGMPAARFRAVVDAAERATLGDGLPDALDRRLREARLASQPCVG